MAPTIPQATIAVAGAVGKVARVVVVTMTARTTPL
jgi:hypothetical protein